MCSYVCFVGIFALGFFIFHFTGNTYTVRTAST